jgi:lipopolysaccharide export system protein LptA
MKYFLMIALFLLSSGPVQAQTSSQDGETPLEITATDTIEWHRNTLKYIARGSAMAKQGDVSIFAQTLTADYRENEQSSSDIYKITALEQVVISSKDSTAEGDKAVYEVDTGIALLTGNNLVMRTPEQILHARDNIEYDVNAGLLTARGQVVVNRGKDRIEAQTMSAKLIQNAQGKREIDTMEANGNVVITTPTETLYGNNAFYNAKTNIAQLTGNVKIKRGPNILEGEKAEVNLSTNISKMYGSPNTGGRVKGTFYPGSDSSEAQTKPPPSLDTISPQTNETVPPQKGSGRLIAP